MSPLLNDKEREVLLAMGAGATFFLQAGVMTFSAVLDHNGERKQFGRNTWRGLRDKGLARLVSGSHTDATLTNLGREFAKAIARKQATA